MKVLRLDSDATTMTTDVIVNALNASNSSIPEETICAAIVKNKIGQIAALLINKMNAAYGGAISLGYPYGAAYKIYLFSGGTWSLYSNL